MTKERKSLGEWGEQKAKQLLLDQGYKFITENWRNRFGEIDLIMLDQDRVVFIEVRTKSNNAYGSGIESINYRKQNQLRKMAAAFLQYKNWWDYSVRFDVISVDKDNENYQIHHFKNVLN